MVAALLALLGLVVTTYCTVPAPTRRSAPRKDSDCYPPSTPGAKGNLEAYRSEKRSWLDWLATLVIWGSIVTWVCAMYQRFV